MVRYRDVIRVLTALRANLLEDSALISGALPRSFRSCNLLSFRVKASCTRDIEPHVSRPVLK